MTGNECLAGAVAFAGLSEAIERVFVGKAAVAVRNDVPRGRRLPSAGHIGRRQRPGRRRKGRRRCEFTPRRSMLKPEDERT